MKMTCCLTLYRDYKNASLELRPRDHSFAIPFILKKKKNSVDLTIKYTAGSLPTSNSFFV